MIEAKNGDVLVTMTCRCGSVLVKAEFAPTWRCNKNHRGSMGPKFILKEKVLTLDEYEPSKLERIE